MKIITITKSTAADGQMAEARGVLTQVHDEPVPGFFRRVKLTGNALLLERHDHVVAIPLSEAWRIAEEHEPGLIPPRLVAGPVAAKK